MSLRQYYGKTMKPSIDIFKIHKFILQDIAQKQLFIAKPLILGSAGNKATINTTLTD